MSNGRPAEECPVCAWQAAGQGGLQRAFQLGIAGEGLFKKPNAARASSVIGVSGGGASRWEKGEAKQLGRVAHLLVGGHKLRLASHAG